MSLSDIVDVSITTVIASITRAGFGTPMLVGYFPTSVFTGRARTYTKLADMISDGFLSTDAVYQMAVALKSQNPSVKTWKVGRKASPSSQSFKLTPTITTEGAVLSIDIEGSTVSYTIPASASVASICTAMAALLTAVQGVTCADNTTYMTITPSRVMSVRMTVTTAANNEVFTVTIDGTAYAYTADGSATKTEIRDGLEALIDADLGSAITTTDVSTDASDYVIASHRGADITVTNPATGVLTLSSAVSAYDLLDVGNVSTGLTLEDLTADPGLAADLAAIEAADAEWYGLAIDSNSEIEIKLAAAFAETRVLLFGASTIDTTVKDANVTTDVGSDLAALGYDRTFLIYGGTTGQFPAVAWLGVALAKDPGSITWAFKKLVGVTSETLTGAQETALNTKKVNHYQTISGAPVTQKGYAVSGKFLDLVHGIDWFRSRIQERFYGLLVSNDKLPYTDASVDKVRAELLAQMQEAVNKGLLAPNTEDQPHIVNAPLVADVDDTDRADRILPDIDFSAYLAGAVHSMVISGTLSV